MNSSGNKLLQAKMRDGERWVYTYREAAMERALQEARHRSFFGALFFAAMNMTRLLSKGEET